MTPLLQTGCTQCNWRPPDARWREHNRWAVNGWSCWRSVSLAWVEPPGSDSALLCFRGGSRGAAHGLGRERVLVDAAGRVSLAGELVRALRLCCRLPWHPAGEHRSAVA